MRDLLNRDASDRVLGVFGKLSMIMRREVHGAFGSMTFGLVVQKFLNIE
jgi:hypothetical protein